jgi:phosphoribosylaminoimidazole-succinocarboxamide synthase
MLGAIESRTKGYESLINKQRSHTVKSTDIVVPSITILSKHAGKVRDVYHTKDYIIMIATDRQSAFDRALASVPFKGQVLNLTSKWWFEKTAHIVPNHILANPHPNITIGKRCTVFPIEFVMRGYLTGSTSTSIWTNYSKGVRHYCGHTLPEGMIKNHKLAANLLTPTTKDEVHDELISAEEIISSGKVVYLPCTINSF